MLLYKKVGAVREWVLDDFEVYLVFRKEVKEIRQDGAEVDSKS